MSNFEEFDNPNPAPADHPEPQSMSLLGGIAGGGDHPAFDLGQNQESRRVTQQSIIVGLTVTVIAFGALMAMRVTQKSADASTVSPETQQFMDTLGSKLNNLDKMSDDDTLNPKNIKRLFQDTASIVAAIENDPTEKQVPLTQVQMNPFTPVYTKKAPAVAETGPSAEALRKVKLQNLYAELGRVEIKSIVGGSRPRAFIGGDLYKIGDQIGSFVIRGIDSRKVTFEAEGFELRPGEPRFILGMSQSPRR
ncbi:MAG: hypothetical protein AAGG38_08790 [Planctomycetota bacterium]